MPPSRRTRHFQPVCSEGECVMKGCSNASMIGVGVPSTRHLARRYTSRSGRPSVVQTTMLSGASGRRGPKIDSNICSIVGPDSRSASRQRESLNMRRPTLTTQCQRGGVTSPTWRYETAPASTRARPDTMPRTPKRSSRNSKPNTLPVRSRGTHTSRRSADSCASSSRPPRSRRSAADTSKTTMEIRRVRSAPARRP